MMMGYLDGAQYDSARLDSYLGRSAQGTRGAMLFISSAYDEFRKFVNGPNDKLDAIGHKPNECRTGDRFKVHFDFVARRATAFYNDQRLGLIADALPQKLYLALSLCFKGESVEMTKLEVIRK